MAVGEALTANIENIRDSVAVRVYVACLATAVANFVGVLGTG